MTQNPCRGCGQPIEQFGRSYEDQLRHEANCLASKLDGIRKIVDSALSTQPALPGQDEVALQTIWTEYFAKGLVDRLDDWHKVADERAAEIVRLQDRLEACEAALRSFDVGRESSYWASEVETGALKSDGHEFCAMCPDCGGQPHRGPCTLPVFE